MILVDTSIWIDHLHAPESQLCDLLRDDRIGCHPLVIEEIGLGTLKHRDVILDLLTNIFRFPALQHEEVMQLVNRRQLWGRGLNVIDVCLLGSVALVGGAKLWTRDKRLAAVCKGVGVEVLEES